MDRPDTIVLIPESTRKQKGGDPAMRPVDGFADALPREERRKLLTLRGELVQETEGEVDRAGLLPAYRRFDGNMYRRLEPVDWERRNPTVEVIILSGLKGAIASRDTIPRYTHSMAEPMTGFGKLNRWWHDKGLPRIVSAYLRSARPKLVVDLLSLEYRQAVLGYAQDLEGVPARAIDFPGMGRGSQPKRGDTVAQILRTGRP